MKEKYDVVIIGSGPAGLSAAIYLGREDFSTLIIERGAIGGTMSTIHQIDNYPGAPNISGAELAGNMWNQVESFGVEKVSAEVQKLERGNGVVKITTNSGEYEAKALVMTTGGSYRKLGIEGEEYAHYCATCDGPFYKGKKLVVIGGANSAFSSAIFLAKFASEVVLVVRGEISADKTLQDEVEKNDKITVKQGLRIKKIIVDGQEKMVEFDKETIQTDGVFIFAGHVPSSGLMADLDVELDDQGYVKTDDNLMATPGVFVAGDIRSGNVKQIVVAAGEGAIVAKKIGEYLT